MYIEPGDVVKMRKPHPCGSFEWLITRTGADVKMRCRVCGHQIMLDRTVFEKRVKALVGHMTDSGIEVTSGGEEE